MRYALALYCSDLTDSTSDFLSVGVLVVDEANRKYTFKHLDHFSRIQETDLITKAVWQSIPDLLEYRFEQYCQNPDHGSYKENGAAYHGFISQVILDCAQSTISFSDSIPTDGNEDIEQITQKLFKEKVLRKMD